MIPEQKKIKILNKFNSEFCPECGSRGLVMNVTNINRYKCKKCGKIIEIKYDE